jgi:pilus assembly protein CpaE
MSEAYTFDADDILEAADIDMDIPDGPLDKDDYASDLLNEPGGARARQARDASDGAPTDQPVPRISIHAFCELAETAETVRGAAADRRLARAHVTVDMGGLAAAIEKFHDASTPNLVIVETGMRGQALFRHLEDLAGVCDSGTNVIVIGAANDIALYRELMRRGVSEYLVPPIDPVQLIRTIGGVYLDPDQPFAGRTLAFIGAKGGVGSSTIAHNIGWYISEGTQADATIVDLDLPFGTAGLDFNQDPMQGVADALGQPDRIDDVLLERLVARCTDRLSLLSAPGTLDRDWEIDPSAYESVIDVVRRSVPYVVLDLPHTWSRWLKETLLAADDIVVTATPELASLRNAKNLFDLVKAHRPNDPPPHIVLNMVGVPKRPEIPVKDFCEALSVEPCLVLPFEPHLFGEAANNGQMLGEMSRESKAAEGMAFLARRLSGRETQARSKSLFKRLLRKG